MGEDSSVLTEIVKAKNNIKRKFVALKTGEAEIQSIVSQTFKPIIEPLNKIQEKSQSQIPLNTGTTTSSEWRYDELEIDKWFKYCDKDKYYGPKKLSNGDVYFGDKEVKFHDSTLIIEGISYPLTQGLVQLIFSKNPLYYTHDELETYKKILIQTSVHLTTDRSRIKKGGSKYLNIITKLFPSGSGMNLQKYNLVYWDDPNELVDRLRLLLASQAAGNTGVANEILSIYEELYEKKIIKKIPNV